jgi:hypothetical protein
MRSDITLVIGKSDPINVSADFDDPEGVLIEMGLASCDSL